jgi:hypothetical protein
MEAMMKGSVRKTWLLYIVAFAFVPPSLDAATAQTMYSDVTIRNTTNTPLQLSVTKSGLWDDCNHLSFQGCKTITHPNQSCSGSCCPGSGNVTPEVVCQNADGSAPVTIPPNATVQFHTKSNGGLAPEGTGGSLTVADVGSATWTVPWGAAHGAPNTHCDANVNLFGGFLQLSGGAPFGGPGATDDPHS